MKLPRPRITIRRLMIAVVILAICLRGGMWVLEMRRLSVMYRQNASKFTRKTYRAIWATTRSKDGRRVSASDNENTYLEDDYAFRMAEKYFTLSIYPWLPVEPDPAPPVPLANPREAKDLPAPKMDRSTLWKLADNAPIWTLLWTWDL